MKKTQIKDNIRNIKKQIVSFLSIAVIAAMAVMAYLGLNFASYAISGNADEFYDETNFRDVEIVSTLLLSEDDIKDIAAEPGVSVVEPLWQTNATVNKGSLGKNAGIISLTEKINTPYLLSGRLPESTDECIVDRSFAETLSLNLGDTVTFSNAKYLKGDTFTVVGIALFPDHACNELNVPGDRNVAVLKDVFDMEALDNCCMKALIKLSGTEKFNRFRSDYFDSANSAITVIKDDSETLAERRTEIVTTEYTNEIREAEDELNDAKEQLTDARYQLDNGWKELTEKKAEAEDAKVKLDDAEEELWDALLKLTDGKLKLDEGELQLSDGKTKLTEGEEKLKEALDILNDGRKQLDVAWKEYRSNEKTLKDAKKQLDDGLKELNSGEEELKNAREQLADAKIQIAEGWKQYEENDKLLKDAKVQLDDGLVQLKEGEEELAEAKEKLNDAESQLDQAHWQLITGEWELQAAREQIRSGKEQLQSSYVTIVNTKNTVRNSIKDAVANLLGADIASQINWAPDDTVIDVNNANANASLFRITENFSVDLSKNLLQNLVDLIGLPIGSGLLTKEQLKKNLIALGVPAPILDPIEAAANKIITDNNPLAAQYDEVKTGVTTWDNSHAQYLNGLDSYRSGSEQLSYGWDQYGEGEKEYEKGLAEYEEGKEKLREARAEYNSKLAEYEDGVKKLAEALETLKKSEIDYENGIISCDEAEIKLKEGWEEYKKNLSKYEDGAKKLASALSTLNSKEREYSDGLSEYTEGRAELDEAWDEYNSSYEEFLVKTGEYNDAKAKYEQGVKDFEQGKIDYADGIVKIQEAEDTLNENETLYAENMEAYNEGIQKLSEAKEEFAELSDCRWLVLDPKGNASYQVVNGSSKNVGDMGMTFALIFIIVGALVIYATCGRIVEDQRRLVGAEKALGFYKREILAKYMTFGVTATVLGMILGGFGGYMFIQPILTSSYGKFYNFDASKKAFVPHLAVIVLVGGIILSAVAVYSACTELMRSTAISLMQEKAPSDKLKSKNKKSRLSLYSRLILLNIRTDKKRAVVTIASVAGCCTLLVTGLTMRESIVGSVNAQFDNITIYDHVVSFSGDDIDGNIENSEEKLSSVGAVFIETYKADRLFSVDGELGTCTLISGDLNELEDYFRAVDISTGEPITSGTSGVYMARKMGEVHHLKAGDEITILDGSLMPHTALVAGFFETYVGCEVIMTRESYEEIFEEEIKNNSLYVRNGNADDAAVKDLLLNSPGVSSYKSREESRIESENIAGILNLIALLLVGIAGVMAAFILLNLTSMHVSQKKKELTIMRINGFTVKEVVGYIARETIVTNIIGIVLGIGLGIFLGYRVICLIEGTTIHFIHTPQIFGILFGVLITVVFSVVLNYIALRKIKDLKLTDI